METSTAEVSTPYIVLQDLFRRDEWGKSVLEYEKNTQIYGEEEDDHIVCGTKKHSFRIPRFLVKKANTLKCDGWSGPCDRNDAWREHMNTRYEDEESNYATLCPECWKECNQHWEEMWADYYNNCM